MKSKEGRVPTKVWRDWKDNYEDKGISLSEFVESLYELSKRKGWIPNEKGKYA